MRSPDFETKRGAEGLDDAARRRSSGAAHRRHHALGLVEVGIELADEGAEHLVGLVAEDLRGAVVVVDDRALAVGGDHDVGGARDQLLEPLLG